MALKSTVFKAELQVSDMDRHHYASHALTLAQHPSETDERLVVYRPLYGEGGLWVRPLAMFAETVTADGQPVPRFTYLGPMAQS